MYFNKKKVFILTQRDIELKNAGEVKWNQELNTVI